MITYLEEELEYIKGVIKIRKSKRNRQRNGQKKKDKRTKNDPPLSMD
jgi:transposase-like protein